jgi:hypothetical protein
MNTKKLEELFIGYLNGNRAYAVGKIKSKKDLATMILWIIDNQRSDRTDIRDLCESVLYWELENRIKRDKL